MTKKTLLTLALLTIAAACTRERTETPTPSTATHAPAPTQTQPPPATTSMTPAPPPAPTKHATPTACGGDGSYARAVDCLHIAKHLGFTYEESLLSAKGELTREHEAFGRITFRSGSNQWTGDATTSGLAWTRDGKRETNAPSFTDRIFQRVMHYNDPQKKEGSAKLIEATSLRGERANHYRFTNAATLETVDAWVSLKDGRMLRIESKPLPQLEAAMPGYTLDLE